jgi:hypothetical protein
VRFDMDTLRCRSSLKIAIHLKGGGKKRWCELRRVDEAEDVEDENNTVSREGPGVVCWWLHTHSIHAHTHTRIQRLRIVAGAQLELLEGALLG